PRAGGPRLGRDRVVQRGVRGQQAADHRSLPHAGGPGDHEQAAPATGRRRGTYFLENSAMSALFCLAPRPRTRRVAEMSSCSISLRAFTLPTPGSDSSTVDTFIL